MHTAVKACARSIMRIVCKAATLAILLRRHAAKYTLLCQRTGQAQELSPLTMNHFPMHALQLTFMGKWLSRCILQQLDCKILQLLAALTHSTSSRLLLYHLWWCPKMWCGHHHTTLCKNSQEHALVHNHYGMFSQGTYRPKQNSSSSNTTLGLKTVLEKPWRKIST